MKADVPLVWSRTLSVIGRAQELLVSKTRVYVACFCVAGDISSQWRQYGDNHRGLEIGLDFHRLFERDINSSFGLMPIE